MRRILLVDDDPLVLDTLHMMVKRLGHQGLRTLNGKYAITSFKNDKPHMAIIDLNLPDMNGIEILKEIREIDPKFPAIILTGGGTTDLEKEARQLGVSDFLQKGFSLHSLKGAIDKVLNNMEPE